MPRRNMPRKTVKGRTVRKDTGTTPASGATSRGGRRSIPAKPGSNRRKGY